MDKESYIKQVKQLIKKYHPDLNHDDDEQSEKLYTEITLKLNQLLERLKRGEIEPSAQAAQTAAAGTGGAVKPACAGEAADAANFAPPVPIKNQDYSYYRQGIRYFRNIHPGKFYRRNSDTTYKLKTYREQLEVLNTIFISFKMAEHYFRKVIADFPDSPWRYDAAAKLVLLKKLRKSYEGRGAEEGEQVIDSSRFVAEMGLRPPG